MNIRSPNAPACKKFVAILAVAALHFLVLATLPKMPSPSFVQSISKDKLLMITLLPHENPAALLLKVIVKPPHASPLLLHSSKKPKTLQSSAPAIEPTSHLSAPEEKPREEAAALGEDKAEIAEPAIYLNNGGLHRDSMNSRSNTGAVDQRWLPRDMGSLQSGSGRPDLHARTSQEILERKLSHAAREDCRTKHAHMGLLAIPFLVTDTVSDTGCKW